MEDYEVWDQYPHLRQWFNKLYVAQFMGYDSGPCGTAPTRSDLYVVRPIYNLGGMGVGARKVWIEAGDRTKVEPGYFWCECFEGDQYSATFVKDPSFGMVGPFNQTSCWKAVRNEENELYKNELATKSTYPPS